MVEDIILTASTGRPTGTRPSRRLRAQGIVPAVVYGTDTEPTAITVEWPDLRAALTTDAGLNALITLDVDGDQKLTLVKDMQRHPIRRDVLHVDFIVIDRNVAVDVDVPVHLTGEVSDTSWMVDQIIYTLSVAAKPGSIPNELVLDISGLTLDTALTVADIELPPGVESNVDADEAVVTAALPTVEAEPVEEDLEGEEGEEGDAEASADGDADEAAEGGDEG